MPFLAARTDLPSHASCRTGAGKLLQALVMVLLVAACDRSPPVSSADVTGVGREEASALELYLDRAERFGFSGVVHVARDGHPILHRAYGTVGCRSAARLDSASVFYVASLTKPITATAILQLESRGRLTLGDTLGRFFPGAPAPTRRITLGQLLSHTSGLGRPGAEPEEGWTREAYVRAVLAAPVAAPAGERQRYSNAGYAVLAAVVERASGSSYSRYLRDRIFGPLGMERTGTVRDDSLWSTSDLARACSVDLDQGDAVLSHRPGRDEHLLGATGLVSTAGDLHLFVRGLADGRLLPAEAVDRMITVRAGSHGYGWSVHGPAGAPRVGHTGLLQPEGWNARIRWYPEEGLTTIVLSGRHAGEATGWIVARALDGLIRGGDVGLPPAVGEASEGPPAEGRYSGPDGSAFRVETRDDGIVLVPEGQAAVNLVLGIPPERSTFLLEAAEGTRRLMGGLAGDSVVRVADSLTADRPSRWEPRLRETARWLRRSFGRLLGHEVLHAVPAPFGDDGAVAFARLAFARDTFVVRTYWAGGEFGGMNDSGAFLGATASVPVVPGPLPLVPSPGGGWTAYTLDLTKAVRVRQPRASGGCELVLWTDGAERRVVAGRNGCPAG